MKFNINYLALRFLKIRQKRMKKVRNLLAVLIIWIPLLTPLMQIYENYFFIVKFAKNNKIIKLITF